MKPSDVFVFAGAGVSMSAPTRLPGFNQLRAAVLIDLDFSQYISVGAASTPEQIIADGIAPEPLFAALERGGLDAQQWLTDVLGDASAPYNAAHLALAELCRRGAHVWTVNFDTFIERSATTPLRLTCWPANPGDPAGAELLKPHGTLGGRLAVTPDEVLAPIEPAWLQRFRADINASTTIILLGYSGRDYDFHTEWDNAVTEQDVLWFDFPDRGDGDRDRMRRLFGAPTLPAG